MKSRTSGSSRIAVGQSAPVSAETGFIVMLPQSLYQTSRRTSALASASKPALGERGADRVDARRIAAAGLADDQPLAEAVPHARRAPGCEAARWTTQPRTRASGSARRAARRRDRRSSSGGCVRRRRRAGTTRARRSSPAGRRVAGAEQRRDRGATSRQRRRLERRSPPAPAGRASAASSLTAIRATDRLPRATRRCRPSRADRGPASRRAPAPRPRDRPRARRAAIRPPTAPRPTTAIFIGRAPACEFGYVKPHDLQ